MKLSSSAALCAEAILYLDDCETKTDCFLG